MGQLDTAFPWTYRPVVGYFQARLESSSRRKSSDDIIADSPYAAGGSSSTTTNRNNHSTNHNNSNGSSNAAWKHKHTKTLPWGEDRVVGMGGGGGGSGGSGGSCSPEADDGRQEGGFGREPAVDRLAQQITEGGRGRRVREGYRFQVWYAGVHAADVQTVLELFRVVLTQVACNKQGSA